MASNSIISDRELESSRVRYRDFAPERLCYGTVRDFADGLEHLHKPARLQGDPKDLRRPWMLKAILGTGPRGSTLVEIGAGEPLIAHTLVRAGYKVTEVDPYDGSGGGPTDLERLRRAYRGVGFIVKRFETGK